MQGIRNEFKDKIKEYSPIGILKATLQLIRFNRRSLLLFTVLYKLITIFIMLPLISLVSNFVLRKSGYSYITSENIMSVIKNPITSLMVCVLLLLVAIFTTIEVSAYVTCFQYSRDFKKISARNMLFVGIGNTIRIFSVKKITFLLYILLMVPVINYLFIILGISNASVPSYILKTLERKKYFYLILNTIMVIAGVITLFGIFISHYCLGEHKSFKNSIRNSLHLLKRRKMRTVWYLLVWDTILTVILFVFYIGIMILVAIIVLLCYKNSLVNVMFISVLGKVNVFILLITVVFATLTNVAIVSAMYYRYKKENGEDVRIVALKTKDYSEKKNKTKQYIGVVISIVLIVNTIYFYNLLYNGVFGAEDALSPIKITSHRGNSITAPENTLEAIISAVDELADYAEIDVQETKDGTVVLLHDPSLRRTTGVNKYIWELTYEEVSKLSAGAWFSEEYADARIPTLDEVLQYCKGKINLNIELKNNGHGQDLESKVVSLIEQYGFERQCVLTSSNYECLVNVKKLNKNLKTGYIMHMVYGNFYDKGSIDFFSMKSSFITQRVVKEAHSRGKEVHAWTVNTKNEMDRLNNMGVDNIITDKPVKAREVLYRKASNQTIQSLLKRVVNQ